ncbi:hypothetical protein DO97_02940 [Neosynechococcus sphagnicola sy1]|uniref:DUF1995 domain-containing protein n=1 Tax=Neosynechococcus sphagnicola sy1 TaxID=1497020 RepID=A0A098TL49_9CYAN|nr:DUF1995 family protein [Neosynechococcus sphagnicola]KGF73016.1 hypothetical protein DO97_02940 [Neosynechococcus sphagnicola sy1]
MVTLPQSLEEAIDQSRSATQAAISAGYTRLQIELLLPELKPMPVAQEWLLPTAPETWLPAPCKVLFADAGAGALARREWPLANVAIYGLGELKATVEPGDQSFVLIAPSAVEVETVEKLCQQVGERPLIMLNPRLEDASVTGIGYVGRQLRQRFLNTFEPCYYLRPLEGAVLFRSYPTPWQIWLEQAGSHQCVAEVPLKPIGDELDRLLMQASGQRRRQGGFLADLQRLLRTLNR